MKKLLSVTPKILASVRSKMARMLVLQTKVMVLKDRKSRKENIGYLLGKLMIVIRNLVVNMEILTLEVNILL